jgi:hypothetical protein
MNIGERMAAARRWNEAVVGTLRFWPDKGGAFAIPWRAADVGYRAPKQVHLFVEGRGLVTFARSGLDREGGEDIADYSEETAPW